MELEDLLFNLGNCWCTVLTDNGWLGDCCVVTDPSVVDCCPGFAWTRFVNSAPSGPSLKCIPPYWETTFEFGIVRCAPSTCGDISNPCCESEADSALQQVTDFKLMQRALYCCLAGLENGPTFDDMAVDYFRAEAPEGGCIQSVMQFRIRHANYCAC